nr:transposase, MuDR, MULE transposase domain protein [Tanacetum cinerariifolium]
MGTALIQRVLEDTPGNTLSSINLLIEATENSPEPSEDHDRVSFILTSETPSTLALKASNCSCSAPPLGWKLRRRKWTDTTERLIDGLESAYGRMYVEGHVNIFAMVDIDLFTVIALNMMVVQLGRMYVEGHVNIFDMVDIDLFTVVALNMMTLTPPRFRATIVEITDEPGSIASIEHRSEKMLLLTWHDSNELNKEPICDFVTSRVDDLDLNLNKPVDLNVSQIKTQSELPVFEELDVGRTQEHIMVEGNGQEDVSASSDEHFFYDDEGIDSAYETQYDVRSSEDAVPDDVLKGEDVDVINPDGFDSPVPDDVLEGEDVDVINPDGFDSPAFKAKAKAKAEKEIRGDHVLQYSMLRDYVVELQSTNLNTTVKITIEGNNDPSLPTRVFQRALKLDFRACKRELLGLDGAFMKGPFLCQVLAAVGLD